MKNFALALLCFSVIVPKAFSSQRFEVRGNGIFNPVNGELIELNINKSFVNAEQENCETLQFILFQKNGSGYFIGKTHDVCVKDNAVSYETKLRHVLSDLSIDAEDYCFRDCEFDKVGSVFIDDRGIVNTSEMPRFGYLKKSNNKSKAKAEVFNSVLNKISKTDGK